MPRTELLSDKEYEILKLVREASNTHQSSAVQDMRGELELIYHDLSSATPYNQNEVLNDAILRIYTMLY